MTAPAPGVPDRGTSGSTTTTGTRGATAALLVLLGAGLALRAIIAYRLPGSGFSIDLNAFRYWADNLATEGPFGFYQRPFFHDYTPGYLYLLWAVGIVGNALGGIGDLIKVPAILADLGIAVLVNDLVVELTGNRRRGLIAAAIVLFTPITWFDSVVWGQVDSVGVVFLLLGVRDLWRDRPERAALWAATAAVVKPQLGILVPIVAVVVIRRALVGQPAPERAAARGDDATVAPVTDEGRSNSTPPVRPYPWWRIVTTGLTGLLTAVLLAAPFGLSLPDLLHQVAETAGGYPWLTVNAYNPWALLSHDGVGLAASGQWLCDAITTNAAGISAGTPCPPGSETLVGPFWAVAVGGVLLGAAALVTLAVLFRRPDRRTILVAVAVLAFAFFVLPTRVHERYLYPFVALGAVLAVVSWRWLVAYAVASVTVFLNMYVVLTTLYPDNPQIADWLGIGPGIRSPGGVATIAIVNGIAFLWVIVQLRGAARRRLARDVAAAAVRRVRVRRDPAVGDPTPSGATTPSPLGPPVATAAAAGPAGGPAAGVAGFARGAAAGGRFATSPSDEVASTAGEWLPPPNGATGEIDDAGWDDRRPGVWDWVRSRLERPSIRPDRSGSLAGEAGGRLDRLDVWMLAVLVVASLVLRTWRLAEPYQMHFDEVYHARTATEFLEKWRYGMDHDIYEWTHPHVAKYAMAAGIVLFGDDQVSATGNLGVPVVSAAVEPMRDDGTGRTAGDRLYVATGSDVRAFDLSTRRPVGRITGSAATTVAFDASSQRVFVGAADGSVRVVETSTTFDATAPDPSTTVPSTPVVTVDGPVTGLAAADDGGWLAVSTRDHVTLVDADTGTVLGTASVPGLAEVVAAGKTDVLFAHPAEVADPAAAADELVKLFGGSRATYTKALASDEESVAVPVTVTEDSRANVDAAITGGALSGFVVEQRARAVAAGSNGVTFLSPANAAVTAQIRTTGAATGLVSVPNLDVPRLYVATGKSITIVSLGSDPTDAPTIETTMPMPGTVQRTYWDPATLMVHALGRTADGSQSTVYVIEPHGNAVYADARLPLTPSATALDIAPDFPSSDREQLLAFDTTGRTAVVDVGQNAFAWRLPGVIAGAFTTALVYLLGRLLFRRRSVALIAGGLVLADGMFFVMARIGMNDAYVGLFLAAAYALFAALWLNRLRWRLAFWIAMPVLGVLLGLGLASKWVAAYAIGAVGILILARSALGRVVLVAGMIAATAVLGYLAIDVPAGSASGPNLTFMLIMVALTGVAVGVSILHPVAWTPEERWFAVLAPVVAGIVIAAVALVRAAPPVHVSTFALPLVGIGVVVALAGVAAELAFRVAAPYGFGPLAVRSPDDPDVGPPAPPPPGWLRLGWGFGLPALWMAACLVALPLAVYVVSYLPWAAIDGNQLVPGYPPGHTGQTLVQLTQQMYDYHNNLRSPHAASSPWWAWPLDLKPVWFYQGSFADTTAASIYDAGNIVIWWLSIPALAFVAYQAYRRRSLALALIAVGYACQWLAWARIDRATFQYHYYTSLPFVVLALAYFLAEVWHGPCARTWLLARVSAAVVVVGPMVMWVFKAPLCTFVGVDRASPGSLACQGNPGNLVVTSQTAALAAVVVVAVVLIVREVVGLGRASVAPARGRRLGRSSRTRLLRIAAVAAVAGVATVATTLLDPTTPIVSLQGFRPELAGLLLLIPLGGVAWVIATARDPRRFTIGALAGIAGWFLVLYPNISALPLPTSIVNAYQGLLPTYLYPFQFPVNTDPIPPPIKLFAVGPLMLVAGLVLFSVVLAYSAWVWRLAAADRDDGPDDPEIPSRPASPASRVPA